MATPDCHLFVPVGIQTIRKSRHLVHWLYYITSEAAWGVIPASTWKIAALSFFSYSNFVLIGYLKDTNADAATDYKIFPVIYGWEMTLRLGWVELVLRKRPSKYQV